MANRLSNGKLLAQRELPLFIKWAGGKSQLLVQFRELFPRSFEDYYEPFVGSGAVFFYVKSHLKPKRVILSDINEELINCYTVVRDDVFALIQSLASHKRNHSKEYFYSIRSLKPDKLTHIERAARLVYLNKTCFNGLYRVNSKGEFNVPFGDYSNPSIFNEQTLYEASRLLQGVEIKVQEFDSVIDFAKKNDFIYLDPPYVPLSRTSNFTGYTKGEFLMKEQRRLAEVFKILDSRGCYVMLSNSDHPALKELYREYERYTVKVRAKRMINSVGTRRGEINELVVKNFENPKLTIETYL
jgi:DNA adenine methylase